MSRIPEGPARRVALSSALIALLLAVAVGVTIWRYDHATSSYKVAVVTRDDQVAVERAVTLFWRERESTNEFLIKASPDVASEASGEFAQFGQATQNLGANDAVERSLAQQARNANSNFAAAFQSIGGAAGKGSARELAAIAVLDGHESSVLTPLTALQAHFSQKVSSVNGDANSARDEALLVGVILGSLALLLALALGTYSTLLISRMLGRLRRTASVLARSAIEIRAASREAAAATSEQSSAVTETSATTEELAATAAAIAENARKVADAAQHTGEVMSDMQGTVKAIAERSLSLGDRSKKIEEILELINDIAEQTNLLALNAAIEAARAGDAGKGFAVVAAEVRKLAEHSIRSTDSIREIIAAVLDETNATIMATEQGTRQAGEVGELMGSTAVLLEESILATQQQKSAADQVADAIAQIREAADQLAAEQSARVASAEQLEALVTELESTLAADSRS
jgi:methyl-accepting chemotaxis protein